MGADATLYFVHDPMCSWCWAFRPVWGEIARHLPFGVTSRRLLGGLAPDSQAPMPDELQQKLQSTWRVIQRRVPGTRFNFDFWSRCAPRRATYPACRAVIAAREQDPALEEPMILAIQQAYYLQARNPSDDATLVALAGEIGADGERFAAALNAPQVHAALLQEIAEGEVLGASGFPSLVLEQAGRHRLLEYSYTDPEVVLAQLRRSGIQ